MLEASRSQGRAPLDLLARFPPRRTTQSSGPMPATLRASVGSTEAGKDVVARVGVVGHRNAPQPGGASDHQERLEPSLRQPAMMDVIDPTREIESDRHDTLPLDERRIAAVHDHVGPRRAGDPASRQAGVAILEPASQVPAILGP